ncbi:MAG: extracellular solute-binding protein [Gammaproteobacteria bacterium]|nr:extracellular solute-binding protein [Gammaproteobacteria bacterium]
MRSWTLIVTLLLWMQPLAANELRLWHSHQSLHASNFIDQLVAEYRDGGGEAIAVTVLSPSEIKVELLLAADAGLLPDLILMPSDFIGLHQQLGLIPLDNRWNPPGLMASTLETARIGHQQWGIPLIQGNQLLLYYNRSLINEPASTWQQLQAQQAMVEAKGKKLIGWNYGEMYWLTAFLGAFGGWPMTDGQITLDTPAMVATLEHYRGLSGSGLISARCTYYCAHQAFIAGDYAYAINGDWALGDMRQALGEQLGIALLPAIGDRPMKPMRATHLLSIPKKSHAGRPDEARVKRIKALIAYLLSDQGQRRLFALSGQLPVVQSAYNHALASGDDYTRVLLAQLAQSAPMPSDPKMTIAWQAMAKGFARLMRGATAAEAAAIMQQQADRELQRTP